MIRSPLLNEFLTLRNSIDRLAEDAFTNEGMRTLWSRTGNGGTASPMPLDVYATDEQVVILAAVPGMHPDDLELTVHQNTVTLSGSVRSVTESEEAKQATWYIHELGSGTYRRSVTLPFQVDADQAEATFRHGILHVVLPKLKPRSPE